MSRERRFFVADIDASPLALSPDEAHHLLHVLRLREGADVVVFDGRGRAARAKVLDIIEDSVTLEPLEDVSPQESPLDLTVAVAVPKGDTMSLIVQKLTELGVHAVQPLLSDNGEMSSAAVTKRCDRWKRVALEAAKQCGRSRLPRIEPPATFDAVARNGALVLTPGAPPLTASLDERTAVLIGPEGGWSIDELEIARDRKLPVFGLGPRTLRTETATIAAATLLQWRAGDLG